MLAEDMHHEPRERLDPGRVVDALDRCGEALGDLLRPLGVLVPGGGDELLEGHALDSVSEALIVGRRRGRRNAA